MEDLLPYYERELGFLRRYSQDFADRYPKIAGRLRMSGDISQDPHVERMIESFALLTARVSKRIEDDYPDFTEALFEVLYPHYLRPFPACSIARFDAGLGAAQLGGAVTIDRGTELKSRPVRGVACRFRTVYPVHLAPVRLSAARFNPILQTPQGARPPSRACAGLTIELEYVAEQGDFTTLDLGALRLFTDGEPSLCAALRDALGLNATAAWIESGRSGRWDPLAEVPLRAVGFDEDEGLFGLPARSNPAYRLLTELFAFPEKFGFFDLLLDRMPLAGCRHLRVHLALAGIPPDSAASRLLEGVGRQNLPLGCTPVVNLFQQAGEPIRVSHTAVSYPVLADARRAFAYEVHSIDSVRRVQHTAHGEEVVEFRPLYSLQHGQCPDRGEHYWVSHRDEAVALQSPGHELSLSVVDLYFDPTLPSVDVLSLELTCSNRDLPGFLAYGVPGGDLSMEGGGVARSIALLRKPTAPMRFERGRGAHWRLVSQLSLNHLSLGSGGVETFKELLRLYDLPRTAISRRQIEGVSALRLTPANAWLPGARFPALVRGVEVHIDVDEESLVGAGLHIFAGVLDRFFGLYVHANSFSRLVFRSSRTGEELIRCAARSGESILL